MIEEVVDGKEEDNDEQCCWWTVIDEQQTSMNSKAYLILDTQLLQARGQSCRLPVGPGRYHPIDNSIYYVVRAQ